MRRAKVIATAALTLIFGYPVWLALAFWRDAKDAYRIADEVTPHD